MRATRTNPVSAIGLHGLQKRTERRSYKKCVLENCERTVIIETTLNTKDVENSTAH